ncbi:MAG TPA: hypothetical protein G4O11_03205 [Anaerolineae bacterium]|nr:hypothetical protein [Anaerolineae bacterium]
MKHAKASSVLVTLRIHEEEVTLSIADNGQGYEPEKVLDKGGLGLVSMKERVEKIDGQLIVRSILGEGTEVKISAPLKWEGRSLGGDPIKTDPSEVAP